MMIEETVTGKAMEIARSEGKQQKIKEYRNNLSSRLRKIKKVYQEVSFHTQKSEAHHWLCDNYYVIEKESVQAARGVKKAVHIGEKNLGVIFGLMEQLFSVGEHALSKENIKAALTAQNEITPLTYQQLEIVPLALRYALLSGIYNAVCNPKETPSPEKTLAYAIGGLDALYSIDFEEIIHSCSEVEKILSKDPANIYPKMTPQTRNHYRYRVSLLAKAQRKTEQEVAKTALLRALEGHGDETGHVGYTLLRSTILEKNKLLRGNLYLVSSIVAPLLLAVLLSSWGRNYWLILLLYFPLWEVTRPVLEWLFLQGVGTSFIPQMDLTHVEKQKQATAVTVVTLLPSLQELSALKKRLEQLYFSNKQDNLLFCVLADYRESKFPTDPGDQPQREGAMKIIEELNAQYGDSFVLFLRKRSFSKTQNRYCGWERKRGAVTEFVRYVKGETVQTDAVCGAVEKLKRVNYLLVLDADTQLTFDTANELVAAAVHPMNRPVIHKETKMVTQGYGIFVPKMVSKLADQPQTGFSRVMAGNGGVAAYDVAQKDLYQDIFAESIFTGKGLIDLEAFYTVLNTRFPDNKILSHDILEGAYLRTALVSHVEMIDSEPEHLISWLSRLHRWIRGDWQNMTFLKKTYQAEGAYYLNPIGYLSKYKLFDNLRRSITPVILLVSLVVALVSSFHTAKAICGVYFLSLLFQPVCAAVFSLLEGGHFALWRKYFTKVIPGVFESLGRGVYALITLAQNAILSLDGIVRAVFRTLISHKDLLEWTTAAQSERGQLTFSKVLANVWPAQLMGLIILFMAPYWFLRLAGLFLSLLLPFILLTARKRKRHSVELTEEEKAEILSYNAAMFRYFETFAGEEDNFLPPDNVQEAPIFRIAHRTSPTNIGMLLASVLAARDFGFLDNQGLCQRISRTLDTVEKLEKYEGNLYNWYDTGSLAVLSPRFVSTVDSGNFVCCLVAVKEGLREYAGEYRDLLPLIDRIEKIIKETNLSLFYHKERKLFSIGYDADKGTFSHNHYDFLMSEARMTSYFAVASRQVGRKHWGAMNRTMSKNGAYAGPVSWTGTMFEYFMPHLLLPAYEGSLLFEGLRYCVYCQKKRTEKKRIPWGISESAFYAFDSSLNYQYKAHGVQKIGVKQGLDEELVVSPYSTFLTLPFHPISALQNLHTLRLMGTLGQYGFYEAVDFTPGRIDGGGVTVIRSYMSHHIGMSMLASCNALLNNRMQKRFMADGEMSAAKEFLQERIHKDTVIYKENKIKKQGEGMDDSVIMEQYDLISPQKPRTAFLTNGELTHVLTDTGAGHLLYHGVDVTVQNKDLLRRPMGLFMLVEDGDDTFSVTTAPFYEKGTAHTAEFSTSYIAYHAQREQVEATMCIQMHPSICGEQITISLHNKSDEEKQYDVLFYLEPILSSYQDYIAHPAFNRLFVGSEYDKESKTLLFYRQARKGVESYAMGVGFLEDTPFSYETKRENLLTAPKGMFSLKGFGEKDFSQGSAGVPDTVAAVRLQLKVPAGATQGGTLVLGVGSTKEEVLAQIISMREMGALPKDGGAKSPLLTNTLEGRLGFQILSQLVFHAYDSRHSVTALAENTGGQSRLWTMGISGDLPIIILENKQMIDKERCKIYIRLCQMLRRYGIETDLAVLYDKNQYPNAEKEVRECVGAISDANLIGQRGGVFLVDISCHSEENLTTLRAAAAHISTQSMVYLNMPTREFYPTMPTPVEKEPLPGKAELAVTGGIFLEGRFYPQRQTPLPFCHVLANPTFGTLVSDNALGFTWAINSRENKLTPWYNDIATDNTGEMLLLQLEGTQYNLIEGARASFGTKDVQYKGTAGVVLSTVTVEVPPKGTLKTIDITLENTSDKEVEVMCAYYTEPVLGVDRSTAKYIQGGVQEGVMHLYNPFQTAVNCHMAIATEKTARPMFSRPSFLAGRHKEPGTLPNHDPCGTLIVPKILPPHGKKTLRYAVAYGANKESAVRLAKDGVKESSHKENSITIQTPDKALNQFVNHFLPHQIVASRIYGRTAFYQCGGAYGFRDQLQDVSAYQLINPTLAKIQIYRCCAVQFEEGDVLHWWHNLPKSAGGLRGVRTRYSDDLLWLPFAVAAYIRRTEDRDILKKQISYLSAPVLPTGEQEAYITPQKSDEKGSVYDHCLRAIHKAYHLGEHGLPLIGCGDWNDGYNKVGEEGKGESVWLALFLAWVLEMFMPVCDMENDPAAKAQLFEKAQHLKEAVDLHAWDGEWYLRAFYDNGDKMGSAQNDACKIDSLPQSFSAIANMPNKERVETALNNALSHLVDREKRIISLFTPAFGEESHQSPGYVKSYPKGIRENGGQYTHGAVWLALGLLKMGRTEDGYALLRLLNPVDRCIDETLAKNYKLEPYYMPADIYTNKDSYGRGGWSLYTGASSWYYKTVMEQLLGIEVTGKTLTLHPQLPQEWDEIQIMITLEQTSFYIKMKKGQEKKLLCDDKPVTQLYLDGNHHRVDYTF